ncbi:NAD-dependent epimerase/dehydratase family protein [Streptomyces sp. NPDC051172]|uniref:NAD-dependent epimerase/dehydratase family protein n=1 Tax=Streptomyces sp. NPDC051172 TaxID=3155796 RepID=UPI0034164C66
MTTLPGKRVLVTGGCSFIGSHLVERLLQLGADVVVADNLSTGLLENVEACRQDIKLLISDLRDPEAARTAAEGAEIVFHLAADHGGRGYIDTHEDACASNVVLDTNVIRAAADAGAEKFVFTSSGCVYPVGLQTADGPLTELSEEMAGPPYHPDGMYGWAKLTAELMLGAVGKSRGLDSVSCRLFSVYGERCGESHALTALAGRAFLGQDPFEIWGNGTQVRNWTHVTDIVEGLVLAAQHLGGATPVNLGSREGHTVLEAVLLLLELSGGNPEIRPLLDKPTGPLRRVASNDRAKDKLGWEPKVEFADGLARLYNWYAKSRQGLDLASFEQRLGLK